jgi:regulator of replication initiation timing
MRKLFLTFMALIITTGTVFAQTSPEAVDIPTAQAEIDELTAANEAMVDENSQYESENMVLRDEIDAMEGLKRDIFVTLGKISSQAGELYAVMQNVNDADMRSRLNAQIATNRSQRYALEQKSQELDELIEQHETTVEKNIRYINRNILQTKKNNTRIAHLNSSITYTQDEGAGMDESIQKSQSIQSEVDNLLNQNPAPSAAR